MDAMSKTKSDLKSSSLKSRKVSKPVDERDLDYSYQIYKPTKGREAFRVLKYFKATGKSETIKHSDIDEVNDKVAAGKLKHDAAEKLIDALRVRLYEMDGVQRREAELSLDNEKLLNKYWVHEYNPKLKLVADPKGAYAELRRALEALNDLSLEHASESELQLHLDRLLEGNRHRRVIVKLNSMLKYLNRDFTLRLAAKQVGISKYIGLDDLHRLLEYLPDSESRIMHAVCFYTGLTLSEAFDLDQRSYDPKLAAVRIVTVVEGKGELKATYKSRMIVVMPEGRSAMLEWFGVRKSVSEYTRKTISRQTRKASMLAFGSQPTKHITFKDLRHSYALHLLSKGVPLGLVAESLGISYLAAKEYYGEFELSPDSVSFIRAALSR
jgi:site-specific recombinase XerD